MRLAEWLADNPHFKNEVLIARQLRLDPAMVLRETDDRNRAIRLAASWVYTQQDEKQEERMRKKMPKH